MAPAENDFLSLGRSAQQLLVDATSEPANIHESFFVLGVYNIILYHSESRSTVQLGSIIKQSDSESGHMDTYGLNITWFYVIGAT